MDFKAQKQLRIQYLKEAYLFASQVSPSSPTSVTLGLNKSSTYNFTTKEFKKPEDREGYEIGEKLGLSEEKVDSIVIYYVGLKLMSSFLGMGAFMITNQGENYLFDLEDEHAQPFQIHQNTISFGDVNSPMQLVQGSSNTGINQHASYSETQVKEFLELLRKEISSLSAEVKDDFESEIEYSIRQLKKGKDIKTHLKNIGELLKDVGVNVLANLAANPIYEHIKPFLGL